MVQLYLGLVSDCGRNADVVLTNIVVAMTTKLLLGFITWLPGLLVTVVKWRTSMPPFHALVFRPAQLYV